jgi:superkiller protein 3
VRSARRAYAKALHLDPGHASAWQDAAFALYHQRQLSRCQGAAAENASEVDALAAAAERLLRGGLRLAPDLPALWTALGQAAAAPAVREYALTRALQLDPRSAPAWVSLARLYIDANEGALAERCLQQARSQDPAVASVWEAMAALAALRPSGDREQADYNEHAVGLGAAAEALLGFAESALRASGGIQAAVYAAARKAAELAPLDPAAQNVWGLACEAKGDAAGAVAAYRTALRLLGLPQAAGTIDTTLRQPAATRAGVKLQTGVKLNLARALTRAGLASDAMLLYGDMERAGELEQQPHAWLGYARARLLCGDPAGAEHAAGAALAAAEDSELAAACVEALVQLQCAAGLPREALPMLQRHLPGLQRRCTPQPSVVRLWLAAAAAAAVAQVPDLLRGTIAAAKAWAAEADHEDAEFFGQLSAVAAAGALVQDDARSSTRLYAAALHTCPTSATLRVAVASASLLASAVHASAVQRLLGPMAFYAATAGDAAVTPPGRGLLDTALAAAATADLASCLAACKARVQGDLAAVRRAAHAEPSNPLRWCLGALLATQAASAEPSRVKFGQALAWCHVAEAALLCGPDAGAEAAVLHVRVAICRSECLLHGSGAVDAAQRALEAAEAAVQGAGDAELAAAHRQVGRCHWAAGAVKSAEEAYRQAIAVAVDASERGAAAADLSRLLQASGRGAEAAAVLGAAVDANLVTSGNVQSTPGLVQQALLQQALLLLKLGELEAAAAAAAQALDDAPTIESRVPALMARGAVQLAQALAMPAGAGSVPLAEARRAFSEALQRGEEGPAVRALLAQVEAAGNMRKKQEKIEIHLEAALRGAGRPPPAELLAALGAAAQSRSLCAKALHAAPWQGEMKRQLDACVAR